MVLITTREPLVHKLFGLLIKSKGANWVRQGRDSHSRNMPYSQALGKSARPSENARFHKYGDFLSGLKLDPAKFLTFESAIFF